MADRNIMTVEISPNAQTALDRVCNVTRLPKKVVVEGLLEWLAEQDQDVQVTLPGKHSPEFKARIARLALERMAEAERGAASTEVSAENLPGAGSGQGPSRKSSASAKGGKPGH